MDIYLATVDEHDGASCVSTFRDHMRLAASSRHALVDTPEESDVVLFTDCHLLGNDWQLSGIARSRVARSFPHKVTVYDERDWPWCRFPGIYVSMPRSGFDARWQVAGTYYGLATEVDPPTVEPDLLFSFTGSPSVPCRNDVFALRHERAVVERVDGFTFFNPSSVDFDRRKLRHRELLARSKFILCPRGRGTSSIRMNETLASGKVPVIISDEWVAPVGPNWSDFSIRWPESRIAELPAHLEALEHSWSTMSSAAMTAYQRYFSVGSALNWQLDQLAHIFTWDNPAAFPARGLRNQAWRHAATHTTLAAARAHAVQTRDHLRRRLSAFA